MTINYNDNLYRVATIRVVYPHGLDRIHVMATKEDRPVRNPDTLQALAILAGYPSRSFNASTN